MKNLKNLSRISVGVHALILLGLYAYLPQDIPMQYSFSGEVNYTFPKLLALAIMLGLNVLFVIVMNVREKDHDYPAKHIATQFTLIAVTLLILLKNLF